MMVRDTKEGGLFGRLWKRLLETSEVAVAVHYGAPWQELVIQRD
jgi:hypothetical protein